jgi:hypothetical protein
MTWGWLCTGCQFKLRALDTDDLDLGRLFMTFCSLRAVEDFRGDKEQALRFP